MMTIGALPYTVNSAYDDRIGSWVARVSDSGRRVTKPHLTESVVTDEPVTRCGRRLRTSPGTHFAYVSTPAVRVCKVCA